MKLDTKIIGLALGTLVLLPSCYHVPFYKKKGLRFIDTNCNYYMTTENIIVQSKRLDEYDKQELFGEYSQRLIDKKTKQAMDVIYLSINNFSTCNYLLTPSSIDLETIPYAKVISLMKTSPFARTIGAGASYGGIYASGFLSYVGVWGIGLGSPMGILFPMGLIGMGASIASLVKLLSFSRTSMKMNKEIMKDLEEKMLIHEKQSIIGAGDKKEFLLFVKPTHFKSNFKLTLYEQNKKLDKQVTFNIQLD